MKNILLWIKIAIQTGIYGLRFIKTDDRSLLKQWSEKVLNISSVEVVCKGEFPEGQFIIMANHESYFDIFAMFHCCNFNLIWFAKSELFRIPIFGAALRKSNTIAVKRDSPLKSSFAILKALKSKSSGEIMVIFPQGTRGDKDAFKSGGILIAKKKKIPIVPVKIKGSSNILPKGSLKIKSGVIEVNIYDKIDVENHSVEEIENLVKGKIYE